MTKRFCILLKVNLPYHCRFDFSSLKKLRMDIENAYIPAEADLQAFHILKPPKKEHTSLDSSHFHLAAPVVADPVDFLRYSFVSMASFLNS